MIIDDESLSLEEMDFFVEEIYPENEWRYQKFCNRVNAGIKWPYSLGDNSLCGASTRN